MKMFRKYMATFLALAMMAALFGCGAQVLACIYVKDLPTHWEAKSEQSREAVICLCI